MKSNNTVTECSAEERKIILDGLFKFNMDKVPASIPEYWIKYEYVVKNDQGKVIGGILAELGYWSGLEVKILWVDEDSRHLGVGTKLLLQTEKNAIANGAAISFLDTFDFQAKEFYLKHGYKIFGQLDNFPPGHTRYYFYKQLN